MKTIQSPNTTNDKKSCNAMGFDRKLEEQRFTIRFEFCGNSAKQYVVRFGSQWIGVASTKEGANAITRFEIRVRLYELSGIDRGAAEEKVEAEDVAELVAEYTNNRGVV